MTQLKSQLKRSADTAVHSVVDTVKANPIPAALVGAGIAWYIYSQTRDDSRSNYYADGDPIRGYTDEAYGGAAGGGSDVGQFVDGGEPGSGVGERLKEKAGEIRERSREAVDRTREKLHEVGERAGEIGMRVKERSNQLYQQGRQRVSNTVERHPLESGLACLAVGLIVGLALPTSNRVRTAVAPRARQLKQRSQEMVNKGRQVAMSAANAAKDAAKQEAQNQGLVGQQNQNQGENQNQNRNQGQNQNQNQNQAQAQAPASL
jgi:ElaB/YqjD/DUF883 family membrane-anchored ribosome-binding protein